MKRKAKHNEAKHGEAVKNPVENFDTPMDVARDAQLSEEEKREALRRWEYDSRLLSVATEEGMGGGEPSRLDEVKEAQSIVPEPGAEKGDAAKPKKLKPGRAPTKA